MSETRWWKYLQGLMGSQSQLEAARFIGISKSNLTRWKSIGPKPGNSIEATYVGMVFYTHTIY